MTTTSTAVQEPIPAYVPPQYPVIFMPIVFIPGVMGTRLGHRNANSNELERIWDPDSTGFMLSNYVMGSNRSKRQLLGTTNTPAAEPLRDDSDDLYTDFPDRIDRGFTEVAGSFYSRFLIELDNRFNLNRHRNSIARALGVTCPVHVFGYDWRIDANLMADNIKQRFNDLDTEYNIPDMPYVVITHSMGGLVSRKFLKDNSDIAQRVTGVIHGNQPAIGSTKFYGYFKVGAAPIEPNSIDGWAMGHILGEDDTDFQYLLTDVPGAPILMPTNDYMNKSWLTWSIQSSRGRRAINGLEDPARPGRVIPSKSIYEYYSENSGYLGLCNRSFIDDYPDWVDSLNRNLGRAENFHDHIGTASNIYAHPVTYEIASHQEQTLISTQLRETSANTRRFTFTDRDDLEVDLNIDLRGDGTVPLASERALQNQAGVREAVLFDNIEHSQIFANDNVINYVCDVVERLAIEYRGSVYFELNRDSLDNDNKERLRNSIIPLLADPANSSLRLKAIGWSSCSGPDGYNQQLSERRANNTVQFIKQELATLTSTSASDWDSRFEISARGEETRAANTPQEQQKSRRVDFRRI